jgi:hypothetical protein
MNFNRVACVLLLASSWLASAADGVEPVSTEAQHSQAAAAPELSENEAKIEELGLTMALARDGQLGHIKSREMKKLENAYAFILDTLGRADSIAQLSPQQRQSLELAQSQFDEIVGAEDEDRRICKRVASTGTRLGALECLTVAQRRARARASRNTVESAQRGFCVPGDGTPCVR